MIIVEQNGCSTLLLSKIILSSGRDLNVHPCADKRAAGKAKNYFSPSDP